MFHFEYDASSQPKLIGNDHWTTKDTLGKGTYIIIFSLASFCTSKYIEKYIRCFWLKTLNNSGNQW